MFFDRLQKLCADRKISAYKACTDVGLNRAAVAKWKNGSIPNGQTLTKLAEYFDVPVGYLLGEETKTAPAVAGKRSISDEELKFALWGNCENISDEDLADVRRYAVFLQERKKDQK